MECCETRNYILVCRHTENVERSCVKMQTRDIIENGCNNFDSILLSYRQSHPTEKFGYMHLQRLS
jgi:hypothetical protein